MFTSVSTAYIDTPGIDGTDNGTVETCEEATEALKYSRASKLMFVIDFSRGNVHLDDLFVLHLVLKLLTVAGTDTARRYSIMLHNCSESLISTYSRPIKMEKSLIFSANSALSKQKIYFWCRLIVLQTATQLFNSRRIID